MGKLLTSTIFLVPLPLVTISNSFYSKFYTNYLSIACLLFDGGYYDRAFKLLKKRTIEDFDTQKDQLEYTYRLARLTHNTGKHDEAIMYYQSTVDIGKDASYYFACNAALQIGRIYEYRNDKIKAKEFFKLCLSIKPDEYRSSLHQKAKAGLNRINN